MTVPFWHKYLSSHPKFFRCVLKGRKEEILCTVLVL